jgi:hypothetical protein
VAGTEPLCALNPVSPQTSRCSTGVPVRTLPPVCSTVAAGGPANTSVMAPLKARCAAWAGVAESGQQPERNECESRSGGCGMKSWVQRGAPTSYLVLSHAHSVTGSSGSEPATSCQEALSEGACGA